MKANVLVETNTLSKEEWLEWRKCGIGGSDVSCLLGINKWKSELQLWLEKTHQSTDEELENDAMYFGSLLEPLLREEFTKRTGRKVVELKAMLQHPEYPFMLADVDGITVDDNGNPAILEIKTASEYKRNEWDDGVPPYYQTQIQHYLCVTGIEKAYCVVLIGGNTFKIYEVDADKEIQSMLIEIEKAFWNKVQNNIRPEIDGSDAAKNLLDSLYHGGNTEEIIMPEEAVEYVDAYIEACAEEDNAKAKKQEASNLLKELLGDYEKAKCLKYTISWKPIVTERFDSKSFKEQEPELYARYVKSSTSRRFSIR